MTAVTSGRVRSLPWGRWLVLLIAAVYFIGPLAAAFWFSIENTHGVDFGAYTEIPSAPGLVDAVVLSLQISVVAVLLTLFIMVPTMLLLHLRLPGMRPIVEVLCLLPLVVPPIVLVVGVGKVIAWGNTTDTSSVRWQVTNQLLNSHPPFILPLLYFVLALPFTYRALDAGIRAVPLTTYVEAAQGLGASWWSVLWRVALPTLRSSVVTAALLVFALAFGEFTVASILQYQPFTVWLLQFNNTDGRLTTALSLISLGFTWLLLIGFSVVTSSRQKGSQT
ncbi:ABC transporter permease [Branchiibius sp. NY16-3462-2]|uniref:ABC transporter permease n=1 Tax=Branchiibius sp. NY16-3462-2 TaxID=1807500 RepID=UPI00079ADB9E|nr:ABC transporter permease subunit [Branchiibius sp. NY16-3462-2]KYH43148.1 hypothetical protein AZH51_17785 [Branchiibius sp. NY16-3462-2]